MHRVIVTEDDVDPETWMDLQDLRYDAEGDQ